MDMDEKLRLLEEEVFDVDEGSIRADMKLEEVDEWNSMAAISLIALLDERFNRKISIDQIKAFKLVKDILECLN